MRTGGRVIAEQRGKDDQDREGLNIQEKARFMSGDKVVAVIRYWHVGVDVRWLACPSAVPARSK